MSTNDKLQVQDFAVELADLLKPIKRRLKLIIHAGTPKTGTTSLQVYLNKKQRKLRKLGIHYPSRSHNNDAPKHQWLEKNLVRTHPQNLLDNFKNILKGVDEETHTILLSSEGFYNHWWDFPTESHSLLRELNKLFEVNIWVWFREPLAFSESFYKQCMRNPVVASIPCYGKDASFAETLADPWFSQRLNYMGFVNGCEDLFGESSISIFEYQKDTVKTVSRLSGLATPYDNPTPRKNQSMNAITAELYRVVNRLELSAKDKEKLVPHLHELNNALTPFIAKEINRKTESGIKNSNDTSNLVDNESKIKIQKMTEKAMIELRKRFIKQD